MRFEDCEIQQEEVIMDENNLDPVSVELAAEDFIPCEKDLEIDNPTSETEDLVIEHPTQVEPVVEDSIQWDLEVDNPIDHPALE